jgi:hypothetical protein
MSTDNSSYFFRKDRRDSKSRAEDSRNRSRKMMVEDLRRQGKRKEALNSSNSI